MAEPKFTEDDPRILEAETLTVFEATLGRDLYPAQLERLLVDVATLLRALSAASVNETGKQNLVRYADDVNLDALGALTQTDRIINSKAQTIARFTITPPQPEPFLLPSGIQITSGVSQAATFTTTRDALIAPGASYTDVLIESTEIGSQFNDLPIGSLNQYRDDRIVLPPETALTVSNLEPTQGGFIRESDDSYRERIRLSANRFGSGGSEGSYRFHALSASPVVVDVGFVVPRPCYVDVFVLTESGEPSSVILDQVDAALNGEKVRPVCDVVSVQPARPLPVEVEVTLVIKADASATEVTLRVRERIAMLATNLRRRLGGAIIRAQWLYEIQQVGGIYNLSLNKPESDIQADGSQFIQVITTNVRVQGFEGLL